MLISLLLLFAAEFRDVLKSHEIDKLLAEVKQEHILLDRPNYRISLRVREDAANRPETHSGADLILHIRAGRGTAVLGDRRYEIGPGDLLHIPRNTRHQIAGAGGPLKYVEVRIFPSGENTAPRQGLLAPRRMPDLVTKAQIDATINNNDRNQPLHASGAYTINYVIYPGRPGPWEAHRDCVDIYFVQRGTAKALLGGEIENAREESPGEIRGDGVKGAREYRIAPGDMVHIPRHGAHHMIPDGNKLAYVLLKIWAE